MQPKRQRPSDGRYCDTVGMEGPVEAPLVDEFMTTSLEPRAPYCQEGRMAECFYCGADEKLTRAHLFQQRIREAIPNESLEMTISRTSVKSGGIERNLLFPGDVRETHVKNLCIQCNSRWMEPIEQAAGPILESTMQGGGLLQSRDLFRLAHWSTIVGALATQTSGHFDVPVEHRRAIRFTRTGQPQDFGTHVIWTLDTYPGVKFDFMRFVIGQDTKEPAVSWYSALHVGPVVMISGEFAVSAMIAQELHQSGIQSYLSTVASNFLYVPDAIRTGQWKSAGGLVHPSHDALQETYRKVAGPDAKYVDTHGGPLVSIDKMKWRHPEVFDYKNALADVSSSLDLSYLDGVFES